MTHLQKVDHTLSSLCPPVVTREKRLARRPVPSSKSQIIIRRPVRSKPHLRSRLADDAETSSPPATQAETSSSSTLSEDQSSDQSLNELTKIRDLLRPPPIPGVVDWGIPAAPTEPCEPAIEVLGQSFILFSFLT